MGDLPSHRERVCTGALESGVSGSENHCGRPHRSAESPGTWRGHAFWADQISLLDDSVIERDRLSGHREITDAYLLALTVSNEGRLVTFDRGLPLGAVRGAEAEHVVVL